jgi:hypothetical protein
MCGPDTGRTIWRVQALSFGASHPVRKRKNQIVLSVGGQREDAFVDISG